MGRELEAGLLSQVLYPMFRPAAAADPILVFAPSAIEALDPVLI